MATWQVMRCTSGQEAATAARMARLGYPGGWWPTREAKAHSGAKQRALKAAKKRGAFVPPEKKMVPFIPGYVFVPHTLDIDRARSPSGAKVWMAVLVVNGYAVSIPDDEMCQMRDIPQRLRARLDEIEAQMRHEREAKRPSIGQSAIVVAGVFEGQKGKVQKVDGGKVTLDVGGVLGFIKAPLDMVERVA